MSSSYKNSVSKRSHSEKLEDDLPAKIPKLDSTQPDENTSYSESVKLTDTCTEHSTSLTTLNSSDVTAKVALKRPVATFSDSTAVPAKQIKLDNGSTTDLHQNKKHVRKRMKSLFQTIVHQMEFYFSDANLLKDRYLKNLLDKSADGYIELSVFKNFNKLQSLHKDGVSANVLAKAIKTSKLLQLSQDECKVKRIAPLVEICQEEIDNRTVYVEDLPSHADHAWVKNIFSKCGKVLYISLPVYKTTKQIKEFAFVEFETPDEAAKACQILNNPLPSKAVERPGRFPKGNKDLNRLKKNIPEDHKSDGSEVSGESQDDGDKEMKQSDAEASECTGTKKKKKSKKKKPTEEGINVTSTSQIELGQASKKKKKKKKKKRLSEEIAAEDQDGGTKEKDGAAENKNKKLKNMEGVEKDQTIVKEELVDSNNDTANRKPEEEQKKKKKKKKKKVEKENAELVKVRTCAEPASEENQKLSRKERKRLRQEDIRRKKQLASGEASEAEASNVNINSLQESSQQGVTESGKQAQVRGEKSEVVSILKIKKGHEKKKVEFDPVAVTTEFHKGREIRKRKKPKKNDLHLRVISKKEWLALKAEYISQQKSHVAALKESLRELRQQEQLLNGQSGNKHVDLEDVFGTKRLKASHEVKMAHVESLKFIPNVIVQWKCSHDVHRDKIKTMFKEIGGDSIAYIDAMEESKSGYIRFKDEKSAEHFAKLSRHSISFSARVLPLDQQEAYWTKANEDRLKKLARNKKEKGSDKIARKVFERNKATFNSKPMRIIFADDDNPVKTDNSSRDSVKAESENIIS